MRSHRHGVVMRPVTISWLIPITLKAAARPAGEAAELRRVLSRLIVMARAYVTTFAPGSRPRAPARLGGPAGLSPGH